MILKLTCINSACSFAGTLYDFNRDLLRRNEALIHRGFQTDDANGLRQTADKELLRCLKSFRLRRYVR